MNFVQPHFRFCVFFFCVSFFADDLWGCVVRLPFFIPATIGTSPARLPPRNGFTGVLLLSSRIYPACGDPAWHDRSADRASDRSIARSIEIDLAMTTTPKKRKKRCENLAIRCENGPKRDENDPQTIRKQPKTIRKTYGKLAVLNVSRLRKSTIM